jgi:hypothetical protein
MTQIKVDSGIPPTSHNGVRKYPWRSMRVGDSFFAPSVKISGMSANAGRMGLSLDMGFICRTVVEGGVAGVRVFRIR